MPPVDLLARAVGHHQAGQLKQAERLYRKLLARQPGQPDALHLLGVMAHQQGRHKQAIERIEAAIAANPRVPAFHYNLGLAYRALGGSLAEAAVAAFAKVLELNPGHRDAAFEKAGTEAELGHLEAAIAGFRRLLAAGPHEPSQANLAQALRQAGRFAEAAGAYRDLLAQQRPQQPEHLAGQGQVLSALGRHGEAAASFGRALELRPDYPEAALNLAICLRDSGKFAAALAACDQVLAGHPGHFAALAGKAGVLARQGDDQAAAEIVLPLIAAGNRDPVLALVFAGLARYLGRETDAIGLLESLLEDATEPHWRQRCHYRLAALYDRGGALDQAFEHYRAANDGGSDEAVQTDAAACQAMLAAWPGPDLPHSGLDAEPIFVIGMPRSGTSLVEQILASHPDVYGAGELAEIGDIALDLPGLLASDTPYPDCLAELDGDTAARAAGRYLEHLAELSSATVVDKMPHNFLHLGLISRLFPRARLIHLRRDALDTCFSCYAQDFGERHAYSRSLGALGRTYVAYQKLMAYWLAELDLAIEEIHYEDIVADLEPAARRLIAFVGLDWHPDCLRFFDNPRFVASASFDQVRQPIYDRSLGRGERYRKHLGPLIEELADKSGSDSNSG